MTPGDDRAVLYHPDHGSIFLDDTIVAESDQEQAIWDDSSGVHVATLSERNASGFPVIAGTIRRWDIATFFYDGFVLIPIAAP